jgi:predicted ArsR family transcriptional regulator
MFAAATLAAVVELVADWLARLEGTRSDAAAHRLLGQVATHPSLDVATAAGLLDVSPPAARAALEALADAGILRRADLPGTGGPGRPRSWWVAGELLDLLTR